MWERLVDLGFVREGGGEGMVRRTVYVGGSGL